MTDTLFCKGYAAPPFRPEEALRYARAGADGQTSALLTDCWTLCASVLTYRVCGAEFPVDAAGDVLDLGFATVRSRYLVRNLSGCDRVILFAATVGSGIDRLIARYTRVSPAKAHLLQAIGAERVESLCDVFNAEIAEQARAGGLRTHPRFSPGYGDLPLALQRDIFRALDLERRLGVTLNESLLMYPSKSVTALIGLEATKSFEGKTHEAD